MVVFRSEATANLVMRLVAISYKLIDEGNGPTLRFTGTEDQKKRIQIDAVPIDADAPLLALPAGADDGGYFFGA